MTASVLKQDPNTHKKMKKEKKNKNKEGSNEVSVHLNLSSLDPVSSNHTDDHGSGYMLMTNRSESPGGLKRPQ